MRNLITILCALLGPVVSARPQYSVEAQIINQQPQPAIAQPTIAQPSLVPLAPQAPQVAQPTPPAAYANVAPADAVVANVLSFSPERARVRPANAAASVRSQSRYHAAGQPQAARPAPDQYFVPQPQPVLQRQYVAPPPPPPPAPLLPSQPQLQPQPQISERSRQPYTSPPPPSPEERNTHPPSTPIPILKLDKSQSLDGSYKQSWESANNIMVEETGYLKDIGPKDEKALVQQGTYSYTAPDGTVITTVYTADEGGFKVEGSHLPTPPPIPEEIQKGLNQIYEGIRLQQEQDAADAKAGKIKPKTYDDYDGSNTLADNYSQTYQPAPVQQPVQHRRQYQQYQPAVAPQAVPQQYQPTQQQYQSGYQQIPDQTQLFQRQPHRQ